MTSNIAEFLLLLLFIERSDSRFFLNQELRRTLKATVTNVIQKQVRLLTLCCKDTAEAVLCSAFVLVFYYGRFVSNKVVS